VVITQGDVLWTELPEPDGSAPRFRRPVVVIQGNALNRSRIATALCVPLTSNLKWAEAPGNVLLPARVTGFPRDSVANVSQVVAIDRQSLTNRVGQLSRRQLDRLFAGLDVVLAR
jgi:mRNA interferase MazF